MQSPHKQYLSALCVGLLLGLSGCNRDVVAPRPAISAGIRANFARVPADPDSTMGSLSAVARHIVAALRNPSTRVAVMNAMKSASAGRLGLNLSWCTEDPVVADLLQAGEDAGGDPSPVMCKKIQAYRGLVLYMDPDRLREWDGTSIPMVTAIANPERGVGGPLRAYRGVTTMITLPADGSVRGPLLVVLPYEHGRQSALRPKDNASTRTVRVPQQPTQAEPVLVPAPVLRPNR